MTDARTEELINAALDNELGAAELAELDQLLAQSAEAREYQASLQQLDRHLRDLPQQDIPSTLHEAIASSVSLPSPAGKQPPTSAVAAWPGVIRYGLAASLGLAVAVGFYESQPGMPGPADYDQMTGTIAPDNGSQLPVIGEFAVSATGLSSRGSLAREANRRVLDIAVESDAPVDIRIDLESTGMRFEALAQTLNQLTSFSVAGKEIHARSSLGRQRFYVSLTQEGDAQPDSVERIRIEYSRDGELIEKRELDAL